MPDGKIEITLGDGTVVKADNMDEAFKTVAKMKEDTAAALKTERDARAAAEAQAATLNARVAALEAPPPKKVEPGAYNHDTYIKLLNEDGLAAANYVDSFRYQIPDPNQVPATIIGIGQKVEAIHQRTVAADWINRHAQEFPYGDKDAIRKIRERTEVLVNQQGHPYDPDTLDLAWGQLVNEGTIKPVEAKEEKEEKQSPNPALSGTGGNAEAESEAWWSGLDDATLQKELRRRGALV